MSMNQNRDNQYGFIQNTYWTNKYYEFKAKLFGNVFIALDLQNKKREVIIKHITYQNKKYSEREINQTKSLIDLTKTSSYDSNIVQYYNVFEEQKGTFIVMQKCECDLNQYFKKNLEGKIKNREYWCQVLEIFQQIIKGYQYLLRQFGENFLHRDIKPQNILYLDQKFKICDFGLSKISNDNLTKNIGTLNYQAPEIFGDKQYDNKCDIYSMGILLIWLLTGDTSKKIQNLPNIHLQSLLESMLDDDPADRISWKQLFIHPVFVQKPEKFLNQERDNDATNPSIHLSYIAQNYQINLTQDYSNPKIESFSFTNSNCLQQLELNKLISDTFNRADQNNLELQRILFALWIKVYDKLILNEKNRKLKNDYQQIKIKMQNQQLQKIKSEVNLTIEFLNIQELCLQLKKHLLKFKSNDDLYDRLKEYLQQNIN